MKKPKSPAPNPSPAFYYASAALSGAAIMAIEILGAKLLAPYVGTSHFVWLAQITVTLLALAAGYYCGGKLADRSPRPRGLFACMAGAALYLAATTPFVRPLAFACLSVNLPVGSLMAAVVLYFAPLCLLAATSPFYVRLITRDVAHVGEKAGGLSAAATLGSVAGTALIGYFTVPQLPNSATMYLSAGALALWSAYYFARYERGARAKTALFVAAFSALAAWGLNDAFACRYQVFSRLYRAQTPFGEHQVVESPDGYCRVFLDNLLCQNIYDSKRKKSLAEFTYMLEFLGTSYTPKIERALCIGMGMGVLPMRLAAQSAEVDVAEINAACAEPAERFFDCDTRAFRLVIEDARTFAARAKTNAYDAVFLDAFSGDGMPSHLFSKEAFADMRRILKPGGVLVANTFLHPDTGCEFALGSVCRTLRDAGFGSVRLHASKDGNLYILAGDAPLRLLRMPDFGQVHGYIRKQVADTFNHTLPEPKAGIVLTDDFNPLEFYCADVAESIRRNIAQNERNY